MIWEYKWNKKADTQGISIVRLKELSFKKVTKKTILSAA